MLVATEPQRALAKILSRAAATFVHNKWHSKNSERGCLHNGRQHSDLMMKLPDEGVSCTAFLFLQHAQCKSLGPAVGHHLLTQSPLLLLPFTFHSAFLSSLIFSNIQSSERHWRRPHPAAWLPTLHKVSVSLHAIYLSVSSFLFQSQHDNFERVLQHFAMLHFVGRLSNDKRGLVETASWVTAGWFLKRIKVYANTINAACQALVINVVRNWVESRNVKWIICQLHCTYQSWHHWDFVPAPHMEVYNQISHGIFKEDIEHCWPSINQITTQTLLR